MSYIIFRMLILLVYLVSVGYLCNKYKIYKKDERGQAIIAKASSFAMITLNICVATIFLTLIFCPLDNRHFSTIIAFVALLVNLSNVLSIIYLERKM